MPILIIAFLAIITFWHKRRHCIYCEIQGRMVVVVTVFFCSVRSPLAEAVCFASAQVAHQQQQGTLALSCFVLLLELLNRIWLFSTGYLLVNIPTFSGSLQSYHCYPSQAVSCKADYSVAATNGEHHQHRLQWLDG